MLYKLKGNELEVMKFDDFGTLGKKEKDLENLLAENLLNVIYEDGQLMPVFQERYWQEEADLWALNRQGDLVLFELKRSGVGKDTALQILRYAQMHGLKSYSELERDYRNYKGDEGLSLKETHREIFQLDECLKESEFNRYQRLVIVGSSSDLELIKAVDYWRGKGIEIDFVPYRIYRISGEMYFEFFTKPYDYHMNPKDCKGIIFDTCGTYNEGYTKEMYEDREVRAWGDASKFVRSFNKNDYVFYYVQGKGVVAVGKIIWDKPKEVIKGDVKVEYHKVDMIVPKTTDKVKYLTAKSLKEVLDGKGFYWARTAKVPYLTEIESQKVVDALKKLYNE